MMKDFSTVLETVLIFAEAGGGLRFTTGLTSESECILRINFIAYDDTIIVVAIANVDGKVK